VIENPEVQLRAIVVEVEAEKPRIDRELFHELESGRAVEEFPVILLDDWRRLRRID
jgi:hypothetical protein